MQLFVQRKEAFTENLCVTELIESHRGVVIQTLVEQHGHLKYSNK